jgi:CO dehydrogenase maturation factor
VKSLSFTIALAGKGGTGKTTVAALTIRYLIEKYKKAVLALDADANANLKDVLGIGSDVGITVGQAREEVMDSISNMPAGMTKETYMEYKIQEALVEAKGFDLLVMGRPEGPGCYCYANNVFRKYIDILAKNYEYIVMDNEAGLEHLSRHTTQNVDVLLVVTDPIIRGIRSAARIRDLVDELKLNVKEIYLVVNRVKEKLDESLQNEIKKDNLNLIGIIKEDENIMDYDKINRSFFELPKESKAFVDLKNIIDKCVT